MRREVERRLAALESRVSAREQARIVVLRVVDPSLPPIAPRRYESDGCAWNAETWETLEGFESRVFAEAEALARARGQVITLQGDAFENAA